MTTTTGGYYPRGTQSQSGYANHAPSPVGGGIGLSRKGLNYFQDDEGIQDPRKVIVRGRLGHGADC